MLKWEVLEIFLKCCWRDGTVTTISATVSLLTCVHPRAFHGHSQLFNCIAIKQQRELPVLRIFQPRTTFLTTVWLRGPCVLLLND
jgi:hypothetical protein